MHVYLKQNSMTAQHTADLYVGDKVCASRPTRSARVNGRMSDLMRFDNKRMFTS